MKKLVFAMAMLVMVVVVSAQENLAKNGDASEGLNDWKNVTAIVDGGKNGKCFEIKGSKFVCSTNMIPIDPKKSYNLSAWFKSGNDKENRVFFGLVFYDERKRKILPDSITPVTASNTVLTKDAKKGDKIVYIKEAATWMPAIGKKNALIAFEIDETEAYSDLPNFKIVQIEAIKEEKGGHKLTLKTSIRKDLPAGTKVRCHIKSGHYMYVYNFKKNLKEWTKFGGNIKPEAKTGTPRATIWRGAKFVRVLLLANWGQKSDEVLLVDDIVFTQNK